jgi:hypothetical protein
MTSSPPNRTASCATSHASCATDLLRCGHWYCAECIDNSLRQCTGSYTYCCGICRRPFRASVTDVTDIIAGKLDLKPINFKDKADLKKVFARLGSVKTPAASFQTCTDERVGNKGSRLETIVWGVAGLTYYRARRFAAAVRVFEKTFPLQLGGASPGLVDALQTAIDVRSVNVTDRVQVMRPSSGLGHTHYRTSCGVTSRVLKIGNSATSVGCSAQRPVFEGPSQPGGSCTNEPTHTSTAVRFELCDARVCEYVHVCVRDVIVTGMCV